MTKAQAAGLRREWEQQGDLFPCEHFNQELQSDEGGYTAGLFHCIVCGESILH
jgi:hypothetical protein